MGTRLCTGNQAWSSTEDELHVILHQEGRGVTELHLVSDRDAGRPRGLACTVAVPDADVPGAIEAPKVQELDDRPRAVGEARPRRAR